jgi:CMP-N,N'-diacetyllegionaminic acid synthase
VTTTLVSTDDEEIASAARTLGLEVPFLRPGALAADETPMLDVLRHAVTWLDEAGTPADVVVLLQPTSPLRTSRHIDDAVHKFLSASAGCVVTVVEIPHQYRPASALIEQDGHLVSYEEGPAVLRRQDKRIAYARNGPAVLVVSAAAIRTGTLYPTPVVGVQMSIRDSYDVDGPEDLELVDWLLRRRNRS